MMNGLRTKCVTGLLTLALLAPLSASLGLAQEADLKVDLNQAPVTELVKLPGVGEKVAERIVNYRKANGPFQDTRELMNVRGIGEKTYLKLEQYLTVTRDTSKRK